MADSEGYHASAGTGARAGFGALVNWAGALVSLGLVVGMAVWAVQLTLRDVSGVPVIQAIEGPMRVAPADPGGLQAPHQGLAVNRIAEGQEAQPVPDRLVLAPPPVELQEVRFETAEVRADADTSASAPAAVRAEEPEVAADAAAPAAPDAPTETMALIDRLLAEAQGLSPDEVPARAAPPTAAAPVPQVIPASVPGVAVSPRPAARPVELVSASSSSRPAPQPETIELSPADLPEGTRLVQLGAFDSAEIARREWVRLAADHPDYFAGRPRVVEQVDSGGQTFYRLRAGGFEDLAGARRFCTVLVAEGAACIPVTLR
jgi:hypothetical protein